MLYASTRGFTRADSTEHHLAIDDEEITPETWKQISLVAKGTDSDVQIHLLRPIWWIEQTGAVVGQTIDLSMLEMGVNGKAKVLAIVPTKADSRKNTDPNYKAVTGKFIHDNAEVINLYFTHQETEPLGVTPNHLLWSVTHGGWMHAGDLNVGHVVKTKNGTETLLKKEPKPGRHTVYNLEVHQSHTYYVSNIGVLAHNDKPDVTLKLKQYEKPGVKVSADGSGFDFELKFKPDWTAEQRQAAIKKIKALTEAGTFKEMTPRKGSASKRFKGEHGDDSVPAKHDVDHIIELQLGGADDLCNMEPLCRSVNRSFGAQIKNLLKDLPEGAKINKFTIVDR